jgi:hypothetical protein
MKPLWLAIFAAAAGLAAEAPKSICDLVPKQDAVAVLGPNVAKQERQGTCIWGVPGKPLVLVVIVDSSPDVAQQIQIPRQSVPKNGGTVLDEPGVAPGAYSARMGGAQAIYFVKGKNGVSVSVTNDNRGILPIMFDKLRPLAKKIAGRL